MKKRRKGLLGLLLAGVLALTACGSGGTADTVVLKIDNHDITKYEYMVYLYTTTQSFVSAAGEDVWNLDLMGRRRMSWWRSAPSAHCRVCLRRRNMPRRMISR